MVLSALFSRAKAQIAHSLYNSSKFLATLAVILGPVGYIVDHYADPESNYDTLLIRVVGALMIGPIYFMTHTPPSWKIRWENYIFWVALVAFPFVWGAMLLGNAATSDPGNPHHIFYWVVQYLVALFLFTQLANSPLVAATQYLFATALAWVWMLVTVPNVNWEEVERVFGWPFGAYLTAVIIGSYTNRNPEIVRSASLAAARAVGFNIAHEIRTPISGIASRAKAATRHLPTLVEGYKAAREAGLPIDRLTERQLELLETTFSDIAKEAGYSHLMIDMLLANTSENPVFGQSITTVSASELVDEALQRYPFANDRERNLVHQDTVEDFQASVPRVLIEHVLFNLIKNALYYVQNHGSGSITVTVENDPSEKWAGKITVYDDGPGIPPENMGRVFERFFTTTEGGRGSGIGLNFCKMVMEGIGGSIGCRSVEGEFAQFTLRIPYIIPPELELSDELERPAGFQ